VAVDGRNGLGAELNCEDREREGKKDAEFHGESLAAGGAGGKSGWKGAGTHIK
jgi:hypothetical protein